MFSKKEVIVAYTVVQCGSCGDSEKRKFVPGDVLFSESECKCGKRSRIEKIFGEPEPV